MGNEYVEQAIRRERNEDVRAGLRWEYEVYNPAQAKAFAEGCARMTRDGSSTNDENLARAKKVIETDGAEGYRAAAELVGPDMAGEFLAELIRNNNPDWNEGTVLIEVQIVRRQKGF